MWRELGDDSSATEQAIRSLVGGLSRIAIRKDDYAYYPEHGGWGEPCAYPRSGWLNTDEAVGETDGGEGSVVAMHGHQIYAAAQWHAASGDGEALDLAGRLVRYCMKDRFWGGVANPDGDRSKLPGHIAARADGPAFTAGSELGHWYSHFHARAIALRGILMWARQACDERAAEFVRRSYEFTLTQGIARIGWINCYPGAVNQMESCALGDLVALAVRLSDYGLGDYWDDVDAIARNQLVEQQLTRADVLERICRLMPPDTDTEAMPGQRCFDNVIERSIGSFCGHAYPQAIHKPWVMHCCTSNATQGLYYAWEGILREAGDKATVNLWLNRSGRLVDVESFLPYEGKLVIHVRAARRLAIRVPHWVDSRELRAAVEGRDVALDWTGRYVSFDGLASGQRVVLTFPVRQSQATYTVDARSRWERQITCTFRGSTAVEVTPRDTAEASYPLYERAHLLADKAPTRQVDRFVAEKIIHAW